MMMHLGKNCDEIPGYGKLQACISWIHQLSGSNTVKGESPTAKQEDGGLFLQENSEDCFYRKTENVSTGSQ